MGTRIIKTLFAMLLIMLLMIPFMPTALAADEDPAVTLSGNAPLYYGLIASLPTKLDPTRSGVITEGQLNALTAGDVIYIDGNYLPDSNDPGSEPDKIQSLDGLEACTGVTKIYLPNNELTDGTLAVLENLPQLKVLSLSDNPALVNISSLSTLTNLEELSLQGDINISGLPVNPSKHDMSQFVNLYRLTLGGHLPQNTADSVGSQMDLMSVAYYQTINTLPKFVTLDAAHPAELGISNTNLDDLSFLDNCGGLTRVFWKYTSSLNNTILATLDPTPVDNLSYIDVSCDESHPNDIRNAALSHIAGLGKFSDASASCTLCISGCSGISSVQNLSSALGLKVLYWQDLSELTAAEASTVRFLPQLNNIDFVNDSGLGNDILLTINGEDASHVKYLPNLTVLGIGNCGITDLTALTGKNTIRTLSIGLNKITSVAPLSGMSQLNNITMNNNFVSSLAPFISGVPSLTAVYCDQNCLDSTPGSQDMLDIESIKTSHPGIYISAGSQIHIDVNYNIKPADSGKGTADRVSDSVYVEQTFTPSTVTMTDSAYSFVGWDTNNDGTADVTGTTASVAGNHIYLPSIVDYYAVFGTASYTVTFDSQNGSAIAPITKYYGQTITSEPASTRTGYTFGHWYPTSACNTTVITFPHSVLKNETLFAKWIPNTYTVTYHANNGTNDATTSSHAYDTTQALKPNAFSKTGYNFAGWATSAAGAAVYGDGQSVTNLTSVNGANIDLYAVWTVGSYTISYDLAGGTLGTANPASYTSASAPITLNNPDKTGYTFAGWTGTGLSGSTPNVTIPTGSTGNRQYAANWIPNNYTVSFDPAGGSVSPASKGVTYAAEYVDLPIPSKPGYSFAGWYTDSGTVVTGATTVTTAADHTLHAVWQFMGPFLGRIDLSCGSWQKAFVKTAYSYKIRLGENDPALTLTPIKEYGGASMTIGGKAQSSIVVSPANGKSITVKVVVKYLKLKKTYTFTVTRDKSSNNSLASLTAVGGTFDSPFDPADTSYVLSVDQNTKSVTIKAAAAAGKLASVSPASNKIALNNGDTKVVNITVKAQSGAKKTYTITVKRAPSADANLKSLKASGAVLAPAFNAGVANYTAVMPAAKSSITLSVKASGYKAVVYIDDVKRTSLKVTLANGGSKAVHVRVVAQSGDVKDYYINVQRQ